MVDALLALPATLGALLATGLLVQRAYKDRLLYLIALSVTQVGLSLALISMMLGFLLGFGGPLFRVMELGAALLGPMWLALGMVELITRVVQVRFGAWLFAISYTVVATVILLVDPTKGSFTKKLPKPGQTYDALPLLLIDGAHVIAVLALVACLVVTALQAGKQDREAAELLIPIALVALAGVLVVSGTRGFLPGSLAVIALGGAAGLVWYGAMRTLPPAYDDGEGYAEDEYGDEPATGYEEQGYAEQGYPQQQAHAAPPEPRAERKRADKRGELRFPEPAPAEEKAMRYPDQHPSATAHDDLRNVLGEQGMAPGAAPGAPGRPGGADMAAACGQITVYTLLDGREEAFDRQAAELVQAARTAEPETLIFACHEVVNAPTQRIFYQLFRDEAAFAAHQRQPHLRRFNAESRTHVLATNVIELKLGAAKLPPLPHGP
ncbi:antibiotic biosynthesis monooxygenase, partial [Actinomadura vinacea]|uniref:antibiotic biosynthesis monooxygenase n=1 Tax=Actinomadura vinacea TaxID=115336 RepID=UPI0031D0D104